MQRQAFGMKARSISDKRLHNALDLLHAALGALNGSVRALVDDPDSPDLSRRNKLDWAFKNITRATLRLEDLAGPPPATEDSDDL